MSLIDMADYQDETDVWGGGLGVDETAIFEALRGQDDMRGIEDVFSEQSGLDRSSLIDDELAGPDVNWMAGPCYGGGLDLADDGADLFGGFDDLFDGDAVA